MAQRPLVAQICREQRSKLCLNKNKTGGRIDLRQALLGDYQPIWRIRSRMSVL